jgi:hypothetical protein
LSLKDLIRGKRVSDKFSAATSATFATRTPEEGQNVANVANVAVANPAKAEPATQIIDSAVADNATTASSWWRFHYAEREPKEVMYSPPVNHAEALSGEPDAISAKPFEPTLRKPERPLSMEEEAEIRGWLASIGENDEAMVAAVLGQCNTDGDARQAYLHRAADSNDEMRWSSWKNKNLPS